eukprot:6523954-Ditylum_brightwellii.AAC.1
MTLLNTHSLVESYQVMLAQLVQQLLIFVTASMFHFLVCCMSMMPMDLHFIRPYKKQQLNEKK